MAEAIVLGDSHTVCIAQAATDRPQWRDHIEIYRFSGKRGLDGAGSISLEDSYKLLNHLSPTVPIFLAVLGGLHNILGLVRQEPDFDFLSGENATRDELDVAAIIPHRSMVSAFDQYLGEAQKFIFLRQAAHGQVFLIGTPPPKKSDAFIVEKFSAMKKQIYRGKNVLEFGLNSPRLRRKFWVLECERTRKWAALEGMVYVPAPIECFDEDGFLDRRFYGDATHANAEYGELILRQITAILADLKTGTHA